MKPVVAFRHVPYETLGVLEDIFRQHGLLYSYVDLYDDVPRTFDPRQLAGMVVLGGPMNVDETEKYPFLLQERKWIQAAIDEELPVMGICLGAQQVARTLGSSVYPHVKEIGWFEVQRAEGAENDPLFAELGPKQTVFQWHGDTFDLPHSAAPLATGAECHNQAFRYGPNCYALQFHLEVTAEMISQWLSQPEQRCEVEALENADPQEIRQQAVAALPPMHAVGEKLFGKFAQMCLNRV